jgi:hypothetical protein
MKETRASTTINEHFVDPQRNRRAREMIWDAGEVLEPGNGFIHMGSFAVHIYGCDHMGTRKEFKFVEQVLASPDVVAEGLADVAWKSLGNKIMSKYGRKPKYLKAKDETTK